jgi:thiamine biosynthesis protein ThiS
MTVNGKRYEHRQGLTLHRLLEEMKADQRMVVVMHGDDIYRAGQIPDAPLADSDIVEVVTMAQGG